MLVTQRHRRRGGQGEDLDHRLNKEDQWENRGREDEVAVTPVLPELLAANCSHMLPAHVHGVPLSPR
jgi:hypothetical protein